MNARPLVAASLVAALVAGCTHSNKSPAAATGVADSSANKTTVGKTADGQSIDAYTLTNANGMKVTILSLGGVVQKIEVPDANGKLADVVLGFDSPADYAKPTGIYFGALVGRYANRIAKGQFSIDGQTYNVPVNNGPNSLHGGIVGFDKKIWANRTTLADRVTAALKHGNKSAWDILSLDLTSPDGDQGYPGALHVSVVYRLMEQENTLRIDYTATTDKPTVLNLTNHSYFNLTGDPAHNTVKDHVVSIDADQYTPVNDVQIPTGIATVEGTPFDFRSPRTIGERLDRTGGDPYGYDHNFVLNGGETKDPRKVVTVSEPTSGRTMEVWTTQPGVQFYTANFLDGTVPGKAGVKYGRYSAFCFETQHFPDSPNHPAFPSTVLRPGETFHSTTIYKFR